MIHPIPGNTLPLYLIAQATPTATPGGPVGTPTATPGGQGVEGAPADPSGQTAPSGGGPLAFMFPILIGLMLVMILSSIMGQRKQKKQKQEMLQTLTKHAEVQTIGGILGKVAEVRDDEVIIETDRASGTRLRVRKSAVQQVLRSGVGGETSTSEPELADAAASR